MKYIYSLLILLYGLNLTGQQTHIITGNDTYFNPDTAYVNVGDTVRLVSNGYHSITEVDSTDWVNDLATDNGGFWIGIGASVSDDWFVINQSGKYYFNCNPHATMGMKGVLYVGSALGTEEIVNADFYEVYLDDANRLHLNYSNAIKVNVYSITGKMVHSQRLSSNSKLINLDLDSGIYLVSFLNESGIKATKKIFIK